MKEKEMIAKIAPMLYELRRRFDVYMRRLKEKELMLVYLMNINEKSGFSEIDKGYCERYKKAIADGEYSCEKEAKEFLDNLEIVNRHMKKLFG